jgi:cytoskeletal protein CcmA (bactofilin family)
VRTGDAVTISENQTVEGNFYALGGTVALSGTILGDAVLIGGNVTINGSVADDLFVLGGTVSQQASITEDVRIVAGDVTISEPIAGSLVVVAGRLTLLSTGSVGGDVLFYGGEATIDGPVGGQILGNSERIRVNGKIAAGLDVRTHLLTLGEQADIAGDVQYTSVNEIVRAPGAVVTGAVLKNDELQVTGISQMAALRTTAIVFLISLFATLSLYLLFRRQVEELALAATTMMPRNSLIGFATLALAPLSVAILLVSVLGILIGLISLFVVLTMAIVALSLMNIVAGVLVTKLVTKKSDVSVLTILIGAVVLQGFLLVPIIGVLLFAAVFLGTLGAVVVRMYQVAR